MEKNNYQSFNFNQEEVELNQKALLDVLYRIENLSNINEIKLEINKILEILKNNEKDVIGILNVTECDKIFKIKKEVILDDLMQIIEAQTIERLRYYIKRLKKILTEFKSSKINDLNLNRWKEYDDLITDSLWILNKRDNTGSHNAKYWGNFIPQIPNQFLRRYTKLGEWVLDPFLGSGTTLIECKRLGRNGIGVELLPEVAEMAKTNISLEPNIHNVKTEIINANSVELDFKSELKKRDIKSVQFIIMHPPYWDIIKFSNNTNDLSNAKSLEEFLKFFGCIIDNTYDILDKHRYLSIVIGDKYQKGEWIPLGFYIMNEVLKRKYKLKTIIVKNFDFTKGKMKQKELWRYRALVGGFYVFKHEYILLFQKV